MFTRIKSILGTVLLMVVVFSTVTYTACNKQKYTYNDPCEGIICQNNGTCFSGECDCTAGYTGDFCDTKANAPYLGRWSFTQKRLTSDNNPVGGPEKTYEVNITEDSKGVVYLSLNGFMGESTYNALARIAMQIGTTTVWDNKLDSVVVETEISSTQYNFVFPRYQTLGNSQVQLLKGEGEINSLGTQMSGEFWITYPDTAKGIVEDRFSFGATYIN